MRPTVIRGHQSIAGRLGLTAHHTKKPVLQAGAGRHRHLRAHGFNPLEFHLAQPIHLGHKGVIDHLHQTRFKGGTLVGTFGQVPSMYQQVLGHVYEEHAPGHRSERRIDFLIKGACRLQRVQDIAYACVEQFQGVPPGNGPLTSWGFTVTFPRYTPSANPVALML